MLRVGLATAALFIAIAVAAGAADQTVNCVGTSYSPAGVRVLPSEQVTWKCDFGTHPLRSASSEPFGQESGTADYSYTFAAAGRYRFYCAMHGSKTGDNQVSGMSGEVVVSANTPPTAAFTAPETIASGTEVQFTNESSDPDPGQTLTYSWDLDGDGALNDSTEAAPKRTYTNAGTSNQTITVRLRVTDSNPEPEVDGESSTTTRTVTVTPGGDSPGGDTPPPPTPPAVAQDRTAPVVRFLSRTLTVRRGVARMQIRLSEAGSATVRLRRGTTTIVSRRLSLFAGRRTLRLRLNAAGRRLLARRGRFTARLTVQVRDGAGNAGTGARTLTFRRG